MNDETVIYRPWYLTSAIAMVVLGVVTIMTGYWLIAVGSTTLAVALGWRALIRLRLVRAGGRAR